MSDSKVKIERGGSRNGGYHNRRRNCTNNSSHGTPSFKAPMEGLEDIVFNKANPYRMAVDFRASIKTLANHVGTNFRKVPHVALWAIRNIKVPVIKIPEVLVGKMRTGCPTRMRMLQTW